MPNEFSTPKPNLIEGSSGFSVEVLGRTGMRYRAGGKSLFIDSEVLAKPNSVAVYRGSIRHWEPPHERESIGSDEQARIIENIQQAFESAGYELQIT